MGKIIALIIFVVGQSGFVWAAKNQKVSVKPENVLFGSGSIRGGQAGLDFTLLDLRKTGSAKVKKERIVMDIGDRAFMPHRGQPGYFNIELRKDRSLVIDLSQTFASKLNEKEILARFNQSDYVTKSNLIYDSEGRTMTLILKLKKDVGVKAMPVAGGKKRVAKLVIDLVEKK